MGGLSWHHLQYLLGFDRFGHEVVFFEHYGWPKSCYDPDRQAMISDPAFGIAYVKRIFARCNLDIRWTYLAENGTTFGISREELSDFCRDCDIYFNLSNINWIPELEQCRRRALVDTDPVFTQIGTHGVDFHFSKYDALFTYGERVHQIGCSMPTADRHWLPTRQPVVLDQWRATPGNAWASFSTVINWTSYQLHDSAVYGQKDREFEPYFSLPRKVHEPMEIVANAPQAIKQRLAGGGWRLVDPLAVTHDPWTYQDYLARSRAEFCVAKHGYVSTQCGWFSDRSSAYLALSRPVVIQDTGFSHFLPCGDGLLTYRTQREAIAAIQSVRRDYDGHSRAARAVVEANFDARRVLSELLERRYLEQHWKRRAKSMHLK